MTIKWNGRIVEDFDPRQHMEQVLVKYHMYKDKEVSCRGGINQVLQIWELLAEIVNAETHAKV